MENPISTLVNYYLKRIEKRGLYSKSFLIIKAIIEIDKPNEKNIITFLERKDISNSNIIVNKIMSSIKKENLSIEAWKSNIKNIGDLLINYITSPNKEVYKQLIRTISNMKYITARAVLIYSLTSNYIFIEDINKIIYLLKSLDDKRSYYFLNNLIRKIAIDNGFIENYVRIPKSEYESLKSAVIINNNEIQKLKQESELIKKMYEEESVLKLLREINSSKNDFLLDRIAYLEHLIMNKKNGNNLPEEFSALPIFISNFMQFIKELGIKKVNNIGERLKLEINNCGTYEYIGSPLEEGSSKDVEVIAPGWVYKDRVISKPKVKEITNL
ncbi:MAG: hypothetical protein WHS65_05260 [Melioribacteraceae bacterium]